MKKNNIKNTILNQDMKAAATPNEAWINGDKYFHAVEAEAYKQLTTAQLSTLLHSATALQRIDGYLCLYEDPTMPGDARVDIIYKPSYAIAAVAIYALQNILRSLIKICIGLPTICWKELSGTVLSVMVLSPMKPCAALC